MVVTFTRLEVAEANSYIYPEHSFQVDFISAILGRAAVAINLIIV
jgi:hypothetical protein